MKRQRMMLVFSVVKGKYVLEAEVNPERLFEETDHSFKSNAGSRVVSELAWAPGPPAKKVGDHSSGISARTS